MKRVALLLTVVAGAFLASCHATEDATAPEHRTRDGVKPHASIQSGTNCDMIEQKCDIIRAGIEYLLNHANETCQAVGQVALDRFEAPSSTGNGYRELASSGDGLAFVQMTPGNSYSGYVPVNGYVNIDPDCWTSSYSDPAHAGSVLAHEEQHQNAMDAPDHHTGIARAYYDACLNPEA